MRKWILLLLLAAALGGLLAYDYDGASLEGFRPSLLTIIFTVTTFSVTFSIGGFNASAYRQFHRNIPPRLLAACLAVLAITLVPLALLVFYPVAFVPICLFVLPLLLLSGAILLGLGRRETDPTILLNRLCSTAVIDRHLRSLAPKVASKIEETKALALSKPRDQPMHEVSWHLAVPPEPEDPLTHLATLGLLAIQHGDLAAFGGVIKRFLEVLELAENLQLPGDQYRVRSEIRTQAFDAFHRVTLALQRDKGTVAFARVAIDTLAEYVTGKTKDRQQASDLAFAALRLMKALAIHCYESGSTHELRVPIIVGRLITQKGIDDPPPRIEGKTPSADEALFDHRLAGITHVIKRVGTWAIKKGDMELLYRCFEAFGWLGCSAVISLPVFVCEDCSQSHLLVEMDVEQWLFGLFKEGLLPEIKTLPKGPNPQGRPWVFTSPRADLIVGLGEAEGNARIEIAACPVETILVPKVFETSDLVGHQAIGAITERAYSHDVQNLRHGLCQGIRPLPKSHKHWLALELLRPDRPHCNRVTVWIELEVAAALAYDAQGGVVKARAWVNWLVTPDDPAWLAYITKRTTELMKSDFDGLFVDSMGTAPVSENYTNTLAINPHTKKPYTKSEWLAAEGIMLDAIRRAIPPGKLITLNGLGPGGRYWTEPESASPRVLLPYVKGAMSERIWRDPPQPLDRWPTAEHWMEDVRMVQDVERRGLMGFWWTKCWTKNGTSRHEPNAEVLVPQWRRFALASYLLAAGPHSYFNFDTDRDDKPKSNAAEYFPEYDAPLGHAISEMIPLGDTGAHARRFSNGVVLVNPTAQAIVSVKLPWPELVQAKLLSAGENRTLSGEFTLPAHTGLLLTLEH